MGWLNFRGKWGAVSTEYKDGPSGPSSGTGSELGSSDNKMIFYARDNCIGNLRASWNLASPGVYNLTGDTPSGRDKLPNDEVRSVKLLRPDSGTLITLYDSPNGDKRDDYVEIFVKKDVAPRDSVAVFYEGNNASQDTVGTTDLTTNQTFNLQNHIIENDEIRSMIRYFKINN